MSSKREASHAGSWYASNGRQLSNQLSTWLSQVPPEARGIGKQSSAQSFNLPVAGARVIIAPHAGYSYSGPAAAWAYKSLDLSKAKRVFLLGPSHHFYLTGCALSQMACYSTPLGDLPLDRATIAELHSKHSFDKMSRSTDEDEHSLEMHLPYIYHLFSTTIGTEPSSFPPLIPILVGNTSSFTERAYGRILAPYLADPSSIFVVSSDFAHWGGRFRYTYYQPSSGQAVNLPTRPSRQQLGRPIHESIMDVDFQCIDACESGKYEEWLGVLERTGNTVCGRHPIGVVMAAIEECRRSGTGAERGEDWGRFRFVRYERSSLVEDLSDSSVSYASALAVL